MENIEALISKVNSQSIPGEIWVDGSFLTEKLNPDDVDIAFVIPASVLSALSAPQRAFFDAFRSTSLYDRYRIDNYWIAAIITLT